jgi:hypothetical protein
MPELVYVIFACNCVELACHATRLELFDLILIGAFDFVHEHCPNRFDAALFEHLHLHVFPRWDRLELCHLGTTRLDPLLGIALVGEVRPAVEHVNSICVVSYLGHERYCLDVYSWLVHSDQVWMALDFRSDYTQLSVLIVVHERVDVVVVPL